MIKSGNKLIFFLCLALAVTIVASKPIEVEAQGGAWVLDRVEYNDANNASTWRTTQPTRLSTTDHTYANLSTGKLDYFSMRGPHPSSDSTTNRNMHATYTWNSPPQAIPSEGTVTISMNRDVKSSSEGGWYGGPSMQIGYGAVGATLKYGVYKGPDGNDYTTHVFASTSGAGSNAYNSLGSLKADHTFKFARGATGAADQQIRVVFNAGSFLYYENHIYKWQENASPSPTPTPGPGRGFSDLPSSHWAYDTVMEMVELGVLSGYPDGTFRPNNTISRAEFAKIMVMTLDLQTARPSTPSFADVDRSHWAYEVVESAKTYLTGYRNNATGSMTFMPNNVAVREDVAVAIVKAMDLGDASSNMTLLNQFSDQSQISPGLRSHVAIAVEKGFMRGTNVGFEPQKALTRAEACTLLSRLIQRTDSGVEKITF